MTGTIVKSDGKVLVIKSNIAGDVTLHPGFGEGWAGGLNLGFAVTRGNSETKKLNIAFGTVRTGFHDKLSLYTNSVYATNDLSTPSPTPQRIRRCS